MCVVICANLVARQVAGICLHNLHLLKLQQQIGYDVTLNILVKWTIHLISAPLCQAHTDNKV